MKKQFLVIIIFLVSGFGFSQEIELTHEPTEISGGAEYNIMLRKAINSGNVDMFRSLGESTPPPYSPAAITTIEGINFDENATNAGFYSIPPDPIGAAGPNHLVSVVNTSIEWHTKAGVQQNSQSLASFFVSQTPLTGTFDPKVICDQYNGRFVVVTLEQTAIASGDPSNTSRILVAVSKTSDPNAGWWFTSINSAVTISSLCWADYPGLAITDDAILITNNMFSFSSNSFQGSRLWIIQKTPFYTGGAASVVRYDPSTSVGISQNFTMQPAHMFGTLPAGVKSYLVASGWNVGGPGIDGFSVITISGTSASPSFSNTFVSHLSDIHNTGVAFPEAPQLGTDTLINTPGNRVMNAVWRNNNLWAVNTINPPSGVDAGQATAHWYRMGTSGTISLADQGNIGGEDIAAGTYTFYPSIAVNSAGDAIIGFAASAPTIYCGAYYAGRFSSTPAGTVLASQVFKAGLDSYVRIFASNGGTRNRWGDYSGSSVDPLDDLTFYIFNEYALTRGTNLGDGELGRWGTAFAKVPIGEVIITEIMYNAASSESTNQTQFIEIANTTSNPININNWTIDDEDADGPNTLPNITLPAFGIAIICGSTETDFQDAFGSSFTIISLDDLGQTMFNLKNSPSSSDEIIQLKDNLGNLVDEVNYDDAGVWPSNSDGVSIYLNLAGLSMNAAVNNDGSNWSQSSNATNGGYLSTPSGVWDAVEVGSAGNVNGNSFLPVELSSFSAIIMDGKIKLNWRTETEVNNYGFDILRQSAKGGQDDEWVTLGFVDGYGNTNSPKDYVFVDNDVLSGKYAYRLKQIDNDGTFEYSKVIEVDLNAPIGFLLSQNYPNPFNPETTVKFTIPRAGFVKLSYYNILGEMQGTIVNEFKEAGIHTVNMNASELSSGIYLYKLEIDEFVQMRKMVLIK